MARQITKEIALKIVAKLGAKKSPFTRKGSPHDIYDFAVDGQVVVRLSVRRASEKDKGHDHMPGELRLGPNSAKQLGQCSLSFDAYMDILREKGVIEPTDDPA